MDELERLRSRLAEAEALLREAEPRIYIPDDCDKTDEIRGRLRAFLTPADQPAEEVVREQRAQWQSRFDTTADQPECKGCNCTPCMCKELASEDQPTTDVIEPQITVHTSDKEKEVSRMVAAHAARIAGKRSVCPFCGALQREAHHPWCTASDKSGASE